MVTQSAAGQHHTHQATHKVTVWKEAAAHQLAAVPSNPAHHQEVESSSVPSSAATEPPHLTHPKTNLPSQESTLPAQQQPAAETSQLQGGSSPEPQITLEENEHSPHPEPVNLSMNASPCSQLLDFQIGTEESLIQSEQLKTSDIDDILKKVIEEERQKAERARASAKADNQSEDVLGVI